MVRHPWELQKKSNSGGAGRFLSRPVLLVGGCAIIVSLFVLHAMDKPSRTNPPPTLSASPAPTSTTATGSPGVRFDEAIVARILESGHLTATVHVALMGVDEADRARHFGDGSSPDGNLYWGALFGMETHFANAAGWRRAYTDDGDGDVVLRRIVFHKTAGGTDAWAQRGVENPFDLYVLACAWPHARIKEAMEQPLRDALCGKPTPLTVDGISMQFGGGSSICGYVGQNAMLDSYWDPFEEHENCRPAEQAGVFFICPRSAVVLHGPALDHGLYSILFTRTSIIPEAYVVDGLFQALVTGDLGSGFVAGAATAYARYQRSVSVERAMSIFIQ